MRPFLIILIIFYKTLAFGQDGAEKVSDKAFTYYLYDKDIDSALYYYKSLQQTFPNFRPSYINNVIGSCYLKKGDKDLAKSYLLLSLKRPDSLDIFPERTCIYIGDMFLEAKDYISALAYYDSSTSYYRTKPLRMSRHSFKEGNIQTIYKKAICFYNLNRLDTAINIMTPRIFMNFEDYIIDSSEAVNIVDFYITLLKKKYPVKLIKNEFKTAMKGLNYKKENDSSRLHLNPEWKSITIDCYFNFFGKKVDIFRYGGVGVKDFSEETPIGWRKKDILKDLHKTLAYQKLKSL
jgi:tetratricopeptide (TPR) repeat protein